MVHQSLERVKRLESDVSEVGLPLVLVDLAQGQALVIVRDQLFQFILQSWWLLALLDRTDVLVDIPLALTAHAAAVLRILDAELVRVLELADHVQLALLFDQFLPRHDDSLRLEQFVNLMAVPVHSGLPNFRKRDPLDLSEAFL